MCKHCGDLGKREGPRRGGADVLIRDTAEEALWSVHDALGKSRKDSLPPQIATCHDAGEKAWRGCIERNQQVQRPIIDAADCTRLGCRHRRDKRCDDGFGSMHGSPVGDHCIVQGQPIRASINVSGPVISRLLHDRGE